MIYIPVVQYKSSGIIDGILHIYDLGKLLRNIMTFILCFFQKVFTIQTSFLVLDIFYYWY